MGRPLTIGGAQRSWARDAATTLARAPSFARIAALRRKSPLTQRSSRASAPNPSTGRLGGPAPRIDDYGLIGNLHTAALVSRFGAIDWACLPQFASPSVFGRILDPRRGGFHSITPLERGVGAQTYLPATNILDTSFRLSRGRLLRILDFLPITGDSSGEGCPMIVRIAEAVGGPVRVQVDCEPRFDYGRHPALWRQVEATNWLALNGSSALYYRIRGAASPEVGRLSVPLTLRPAEPVAVEIAWGRDRPTETAPYELLRRTEQYWLDWTHTADTALHALAARWHRWIERSELVLKLLTQVDTGAFVAAPTTSLPEWPGGRRNWDYRYVWIRDAAFAAESLLLLGHVPEARDFLRWVVSRLEARSHGDHLRVVYGSHGEVDLTERTLPHLDGYLDSRPVRVGNGASSQFQLDIYGELLEAAGLLSFVDPEFVERSWPILSSLAQEVIEQWRRPDHGIWEIRRSPAHYVHSKLMGWVALSRSIKLARRFGDTSHLHDWGIAAEEIRDEILSRGYDRKRRTFVQAFGRTGIDAANLRIPLVGFLPYDDERVLGTIERVERELSEGPFVYRYRTRDDYRHPEGAFLPCSFWLVECLARAGRRDDALDRFERLLGAAGPLGLFSEEYDPAKRIPLGNYPQAITHIGLLRAALALGLAEVPLEGADELGGRAGVDRLRRVVANGEPPAWED